MNIGIPGRRKPLIRSNSMKRTLNPPQHPEGAFSLTRNTQSAIPFAISHLPRVGFWKREFLTLMTGAIEGNGSDRRDPFPAFGTPAICDGQDPVARVKSLSSEGCLI
jgi:hypothetical protein